MSFEEFLNKYDVKNWQVEDKIESNLPSITSDVKSVGSDYGYIARLILSNPVIDGRHRLVWLVLAPYAINVLKLSKEDAIELVGGYLQMCNEAKPTTAINSSEYYVTRAIITGLMPPKLETLQRTDSELYQIVTEALNSGQ